MMFALTIWSCHIKKLLKLASIIGIMVLHQRVVPAKLSLPTAFRERTYLPCFTDVGDNDIFIFPSCCYQAPITRRRFPSCKFILACIVVTCNIACLPARVFPRLRHSCRACINYVNEPIGKMAAAYALDSTIFRQFFINCFIMRVWNVVFYV